ncbi:MAG: UDP-glucose 4-epimerase GalE [Gammaproteobacteria bacterium]|nr:UDP-glucose 4-epimerase GalE [Gammaproteobacteria bacterium]
MKILVAGGAGYIGMHTCVVLLDAGHDVIIIDSLINSQKSNIERIQRITNRDVPFVEADVRDRQLLTKVFENHRIDAVINFAGHKAVGESVAQPLDYYDNNLNCAIVLLDCMVKYNVKTFVFSSSATVYGDPVQLPIKEDARIAAQNPYGRTKQYIEALLLDLYASDDSWKSAILRYFNPVGAHATGLIGEKPNGTPNNLMPYITQVAVGELEKLSVFGGDYDTPDGTGIRDYIHVMDLAKGHVNAVEKLDSMKASKVLTLNLGTGRGHSVLEIIKKFEQVSGQKIPYDIVERRAGDVASCYADPTLAGKVLDWKSEFGIDEMCADAWNWQLKQDD